MRLIRTWRATVAAAGAALLAASLGGCGLWGMEGGPGGAGIPAPAPPASPAAQAVQAVPGADGVQRVEVTVDDKLRFVPSVVRARAGIIEFTFRNVGSTPHDVRLPQPASASAPGSATGNLNGGQHSTVRVTVERPGRYPFPCLYHLSSGMRGTLEIV